MQAVKKILLIMLFHYCIFSIFRAAILTAHAPYFADLSFWQLSGAFSRGLLFDGSSIAIFIGLPCLLLAVPTAFFRHIWVLRSLGFVITLSSYLLIIVLVADANYFGYVNRHITDEIALIIKDFGFFVIHSWKEFGWMIVVPLFGGIFYLYYGTRFIASAEGAGKTAGWGTFAVTFLIVGLMARGSLGKKPLAIVDAFQSGELKQGNLVLNGIFSASHSALLNQQVARREVDDELIRTHLKLEKKWRDQAYPLERKTSGEPRGYNLVFLMVEGLSNKYVDYFGQNNYGVTPVLDQLARDSLVFPNFYSYGQRSLEGFQTTLTGVPALVGQPTLGNGFSASYPQLGKMAENNGYQRIFVSSMERRSFRVDAIAGGISFPEYFGKEDIPLIREYQEDHPLGWDYDTLMFTAGKLDQMSKPFIALVYPSTDHTPFVPLGPPFDRYPHSETGEGGYLNSLAYTDWAIGEFLAHAREQAWFDKTVFVITGDHTMAHFQGPGLREKFAVPLLIYAPELIQASVNPLVGSHLDLVPTFIDLLGWQASYSAIGESLLSKRESVAYIKMGSLAGVITDQAYVLHSLRDRVDAKSFGREDEAYITRLEERLLAFDRLAYDLIRDNRWSRPF